MPVTVIGGYLGAGKTTLINRLLAETDGRRLAVLVNDFGAVNIDLDLIVAKDGETIGLPNGCVCCTIGDSLGDAIDQVMALEPRPDHILIEASGVAEPAKVAAYGQGWPGCRLDAVVVLVDAERIRALAIDRFVGSTVLRQLEQADLLVVTKIDLITAAAADDVRQWLATKHDTPTIVEVDDGHVPLEVLLESDPAGGGGMADGDHAEGGLVVDGPAVDQLFTSHVVDVGPSIDRSSLDAVLDGLGPEVVRVKGLVALSGQSEPLHVVQIVGRRREITPTAASPTSNAGQLVVISVGETGDPR